jgi:hypothetical protein
MLQQNSLMYNALNIDLKVRLPPQFGCVCVLRAHGLAHDKQELYARLYELLPFIPTHSIKSPELVKSLLHCLSLMSKDKKQVCTRFLLVWPAIIRPGLTLHWPGLLKVSVNRMAGFAKRLMNIAMCLPPNACLAIISIIKEIFNVQHTRHTHDTHDTHTTHTHYTTHRPA